MSIRRTAYRVGAAATTAHAIRRHRLGRRIARRATARRIGRWFR